MAGRQVLSLEVSVRVPRGEPWDGRNQQKEVGMSRFSKSDAKKRGWAFVHDSDEEHVVTSDTQGERRIQPASKRAEKTINGVNVSIEAETDGKLLERIALQEA